MKVYYCKCCKKTITVDGEEVLIECKCGSRELDLISEIEKVDIVGGKFLLNEETNG